MCHAAGFFILILLLVATGAKASVRRKSAGTTVQQRIIDASQFPAVRPDMERMIDEFRWKPFRTLGSATLANKRGWTWTYLRQNQNAINMTLSHAPLRNITAEDMEFWFDNIHKNTTIEYQDGSKATFPNYLLFHPVDHILHTRSRDSIGLGVNLTWIEFPLSQCYIRSMDASGIPNFDCSHATRGFMRNDPLSWWRDQPQTNSTTTVTAWQNLPARRRVPGRGSITFAFRIRAALVVDPVTVTHTWWDSPAGLQLQSTTIIGMLHLGGIVPAGSSKNASTQAIEGYCNGEELQASITRNILHFIQEYGNLENVIPMVRQGMNGTVVSAPPRRRAQRPSSAKGSRGVPSPPVQANVTLPIGDKVKLFLSPNSSVGVDVAASATWDDMAPIPVAANTAADGGRAAAVRGH
jgi:hypothetical protein